jgi:3-methyladenine DNA glycosylase AlkC
VPRRVGAEPAKFLLKDALFNRTSVSKLADELVGTWPAFPRARFVREVLAGFPERELKARIGWIADCLERSLPTDYREAIGIILAALTAPCDPTLRDDDFGEFIYAPYGEFLARRADRADDLAFSLAALKEVTTRFSMEDAIRSFLNADPERVLAELLAWTSDEHYHVRRLCSEGTRPKLPWSSKLVIAADAGLPILDRLHADPTRLVTRSVANHLNDLAKTDPELVVLTLTRWRELGRQEPQELAFITRHALRTLIKQGHPGALALVGVRADARVRVGDLQLSGKVRLGEALELFVTLEADEDAEVLLDYVVHFAGPNGDLSGRKVSRVQGVKATL